MSKKVEFFFDFGSPYSWLASVKLPQVAKAAGAEILYRPIGVLSLIDLSGNQPTTLQSRNKLRYAHKDLSRWAELYGIKRGRNPHLHTMALEPLLQGAMVADRMGVADIYVPLVFEAIYVHELDMGDEAVFIDTLTKGGLDGALIAKQLSDPALLAELKQQTADAAERGLFGAPSFIVDETLFFGNDRLDFVARALAA